MGTPQALYPRRGTELRVINEALLIGVLFFFSVFPFLGIATIWGSTEAREVHVASLIYETNEWIMPLRNGVIPSKPPLHHWVAAALGHVRGAVTPAVIRSVSLLAASGILALTYLFVATLSSRKTALISVVALGTLYPVLHLAQDARVDMTFAFFVTCAIFASLKDLPKPQSTNSIVLFWIFCGLAVLSKGPLGLALPIVCAVSGGVVTHGFKATIQRYIYPSVGWIIFILLVCSWYVPAIYFESNEFIGKQILFENVYRFFGGENYRHEAWWFYLSVLVTEILPWPLLFLIFAGNSIKRRKESFVTIASSKNELSHALLAVVVSGLMFFTLSSGKRASYLLPLYPCMCAYIGVELARLHSRLKDSTIGRLNSAFKKLPSISLALLFFGVALIEILKKLSIKKLPDLISLQGDLLDEFLFIQLVLIFWAILVIFLSDRKQLIAAALSLLVFFSAGIALGLAAKGEFKGFVEASKEIKRFVREDEKLIIVKEKRDEYFDPILFYLHRPVILSDVVVCSGKNLARKEKIQRNLDIRILAEIHTGYSKVEDLSKTLVLFECKSSP